MNNTPKQYLQGWVEFYKLKFKVSPSVLIPRPETELLVDEILYSELLTQNPSPTILDIGTGSGCIAIALAKNLPKARILATDISEKALKVAKENAKEHRVENRIFFIKSDLLSVIPAKAGIQLTKSGSKLDSRSSSLRSLGVEDLRGNDNIDIVVANLPYIPSTRIPYLDPSVKDFEPRVALDGGSDGFDLYRKLFEQIQNMHKYQGVYSTHPEGVLRSHTGKLKLLVYEIDYTQGELAISEAYKYFPNTKVEIKTDLAKKQRILVIKF